WYQADANKLGVKVTDAEVNKAFTAAKNQQFPGGKGYSTFLSQTGQTQADIVYRFRINEVVQKLAAKHTKKVTQADIQSYYNSHSSQFGTQESRNIRVVLAKTQADAQAAKTALGKGQSWATVAYYFYDKPTTKNTGGLLNGVTKQQ